ncbi:MAG: carbohydrate ABC transporter permease [Terrimicrobiaceae bacterium]|jgi:multiple sugar transport system permease protein|nr:carbohydrate ABC transporter permease [Terrimicrobiaceae bacterium]
MKAPRRLGGRPWLAVLLAWCLAPLLWQAVTSVKPDAEITALPARYWPGQLTFGHYEALFVRRPFAHYLWNSFFISSCATVLCLAVSAPAAYSLARLKPKGGQGMLALLIAISFFPALTFFFPLYELVRAAGLLNNPISLIVPYATFNLPLGVLFLRAYFRTIPAEVEEAGLMDGLSRMQVMTRLVLPLAAPGLATTAILVFIASWNEFLFALTFMPRDEARTVTVGIAGLSGGSLFELPWGLIGAAIVISVAPLLVLVAFFQRRIVEGLTQGATVD